MVGSCSAAPATRSPVRGQWGEQGTALASPRAGSLAAGRLAPPLAASTHACKPAQPLAQKQQQQSSHPRWRPGRRRRHPLPRCARRPPGGRAGRAGSRSPPACVGGEGGLGDWPGGGLGEAGAGCSVQGAGRAKAQAAAPSLEQQRPTAWRNPAQRACSVAAKRAVAPPCRSALRWRAPSAAPLAAPVACPGDGWRQEVTHGGSTL